MENQTETQAQTHEEWSFEEIKRRRQAAYSNPLSGSDIFFIEALRMKEMGIEGWEGIRDRGVVRYLEIQAENPYPQNS